MQSKSLTEAMKDFREALGVKQVEFAVRFKKSYSSVQRYEGGAKPPPAYLAGLALDALGAKQMEFALFFKEAALKDIPKEIVEFIRREGEIHESSGEKTAAPGAVHKARRTGTR